MGFLPRSRCTFLLISLISVIALPPFLGDEAFGIGIIGLLLTVTPLTGIWAVSGDRRNFIIGSILAIPCVGMLLRYALKGPGFEPGGLTSALIVIYYAVTTGMVFHNVLSSRRVTQDTLVSAASVYLLIGLTYAVALAAINSSIPGAFRPGEGLHFGDMLYVSFVTLTTLGFGDIVPVAEQARAVILLEALTGVLYLAFVISRLVGMYKSEQTED